MGLELAIEDMGLSSRVNNILKKEGIITVGDLTKKDVFDLLRFRNFGPKSIGEIETILRQKYNARLWGTYPPAKEIQARKYGFNIRLKHDDEKKSIVVFNCQFSSESIDKAESFVRTLFEKWQADSVLNLDSVEYLKSELQDRGKVTISL